MSNQLDDSNAATPAGGTTATPVLDGDLSLLAATITGELFCPGDDGYEAAIAPWNVAVINHPVAVVVVADAGDVVTAMRYAASHGLQVSVQNTGHGAYPMSVPTLQISTRALQELSIEPSGSARVGAGVLWRDVLVATAPLGLAGLAGSAPGVGVVGFVTGGGIGPVARTYGLASDYVSAFDVVTGDGVMRRATADENADLFWGLRGGKGALGIVTAVEMELLPLSEFLGGCLFFDGADSPQVLHAWREWTESLPEQATSSVAIMRLPEMPGVPEPLAGRVVAAVRFAWVGDVEEGRHVLAPIEAAAQRVFGDVDVMPYTAIGTIHSDPVDPLPSYDASALLPALPAKAVDAVLAMAGPDADCPQLIVEIRHLGGAIARARSGASAFCLRDAEYMLTTIGIAAPPLVAATTRHADSVFAAMAPWTDGSCSPNFQASGDQAQSARKYDGPTLARLADLVATYDPAALLVCADPIRATAALARAAT